MGDNLLIFRCQGGHEVSLARKVGAAELQPLKEFYVTLPSHLRKAYGKVRQLKREILLTGYLFVEPGCDLSAIRERRSFYGPLMSPCGTKLATTRISELKEVGKAERVAEDPDEVVKRLVDCYVRIKDTPFSGYYGTVTRARGQEVHVDTGILKVKVPARAVELASH
jgi:transcription antitermination factor NusG